MSSISICVSDDEYKLISEYAKANNKSLSDLFKSAVLDLIEDDMQLDEERILRARDDIENGKFSDHTEVWKALGV